MELLGENIPISEAEHDKIKMQYQPNDKPAENLLFGKENQAQNVNTGRTVVAQPVAPNPVPTPSVAPAPQQVVRPVQATPQVNPQPAGTTNPASIQTPNIVRPSENLFE